LKRGLDGLVEGLKLSPKEKKGKIKVFDIFNKNNFY